MFNADEENKRIADGGPKFSVTAETESAIRQRFHLKLVELICYNNACLFNKGDRLCGHVEPNIELRFLKRKDGTIAESFICWSTVENNKDD